MKKTITASLLFLAIGVAGHSHAVTTGFVTNASSNSSEWSTYVTSLGSSINSNVNFDAHSIGALDGSFYTTSDGVTLTANGDSNTVANGAGPGQGNTDGAIKGEGLHAISNYLFDGGSASSLVISFAESVFGAGLSVIDYFNPNSSNQLSIEAFTGENGTGSSLGSFTSIGANFQRNNVYFMGIASDTANIRSIVFTDINDATSDTTGIDDIVFAQASSARRSSEGVPDSGSAALLLIGGLLVIASLKSRLAE
ncbi:hypothetical protein VDG1235_3221 [Verrucomicrobiia bacterium DG1235]|nr:hypothetical protein VDG1235_3221 [Verrucomicrobiae bacterium DG1235]